MKTREDLPVMKGALVHIKDPVNREQKRAMLQEYDRIVAKLWPIEKSFYEAIFTEEWYDYELYLNWWKAQVEAIERTSPPRYWVIITEYFSDTFKPDKPFNGSEVYKLHDVVRKVMNNHKAHC